MKSAKPGTVRYYGPLHPLDEPGKPVINPGPSIPAYNENEELIKAIEHIQTPSTIIEHTDFASPAKYAPELKAKEHKGRDCKSAQSRLINLAKRAGILNPAFLRSLQVGIILYNRDLTALQASDIVFRLNQLKASKWGRRIYIQLRRAGKWSIPDISRYNWRKAAESEKGYKNVSEHIPPAPAGTWKRNRSI